MAAKVVGAEGADALDTQKRGEFLFCVDVVSGPGDPPCLIDECAAYHVYSPVVPMVLIRL